MADKENTRIWQGSTLSVRNALDSAWIDFAYVNGYSAPGVPPDRLPANTAANNTDIFRLGLADNGIFTYNCFDNPDSPFLDEMNTMWGDRTTRKFKQVMPEGERTHRIFTGYVSSQPITGRYNTLWTMELNIRVDIDYWWLFPAPTLTDVNPDTGPAAGGTTVTLTGTNFEDGLTTVLIGSNTVAAEDVTVNSSTELQFDTPAHAAGAVTISVTTPSGTSGTQAFTYT